MSEVVTKNDLVKILKLFAQKAQLDKDTVFGNSVTIGSWRWEKQSDTGNLTLKWIGE